MRALLPILVLLAPADVLRASSPALQGLAGPPPGYNWIQNPANGHDYALTVPQSWTSAAAEADSLGPDVELVTIRSQAENDWLFTTFQISSLPQRNGVWIGLTDAQVEGTWVWRSGEPVIYSNWNGGQPDNCGGIEDYAHFLTYTGGSWNDGAYPGAPCYPGNEPMSAILEWTGAPSGAAATERASLRSTGAQAVQPSQAPSVSGDGRWVAFQSEDAAMVPGDTNGVQDVFLRDMVNGTTTRISVATGGGQANGASSGPDVSDDGRWIAFQSEATNLVANDTNGATDVFLHDRVLGTTIRVSLTNAGGQTDGDSAGGVVSADGEYVAFRSWATNIPNNPDTNGVSDIFRWDRTLGTVRRISVADSGQEPNQECLGPAISADGRFVVFYSKADNLLPPLQDSNGAYDVYLRDVFLGTTQLVSRSTAGVLGNLDSSECSISGDGRRVAFRSAATNLIAGDGNGASDIFLRDLQAGTTERISVSSSGVQADAGSVAPAISEDGMVVVYESAASNLVAGDTNGKKDVFVRDLQTGVTSRESVSTAGAQGDRQSVDPAVSGDGRHVVFESTATNLVAGDTNLAADVFRRDRGSPGVQLAKSGTCPGTITLTVTNATPSASVAIAYGPAGFYTLTIPPCAGLVLDLSLPTLGALRQADASGAASLSFSAGGGACGMTVQVVDVSTCQKSGTVTL